MVFFSEAFKGKPASSDGYMYIHCQLMNAMADLYSLPKEYSHSPSNPNRIFYTITNLICYRRNFHK
jgi:hypothetical protein